MYFPVQEVTKSEWYDQEVSHDDCSHVPHCDAVTSGNSTASPLYQFCSQNAPMLRKKVKQEKEQTDCYKILWCESKKKLIQCSHNNLNSIQKQR